MHVHSDTYVALVSQTGGFRHLWSEGQECYIMHCRSIPYGTICHHQGTVTEDVSLGCGVFSCLCVEAYTHMFVPYV